MSMTATDFQALAGIIASEYIGADGVVAWVVADIAYEVANHCEARNPRFDRARFLDACGIDDQHRHDEDINHHTDEVIA